MSDSTTLVRDTVLESSNSNNAVNFASGTKDVTNDIPAAEQATKTYVQNQIDGKVAKAGDTMSGALVLAGDPSADLHAVPRQYLPLAGHIFGLHIQNNAVDPVNDINIFPGECGSTESSNAPVLMRLTSLLTKRLDAAWAVGDNQGGLDTGSIANEWYYPYLIMREDTGVVDVLFSRSAGSPTMPANYTRKRRLGAFLRSGGSIVLFTQAGDLFQRTTAAVLRTSTAALAWSLQPAGTPDDLTVEPVFGGWISQSGSGNVVVEFASSNQPATPTSIMRGAWSTFSTEGEYFHIGSGLTTHAGQMYMRVALSGAATISTLQFETYGWRDPRGRHGGM